MSRLSFRSALVHSGDPLAASPRRAYPGASIEQIVPFDTPSRPALADTPQKKMAGKNLSFCICWEKNMMKSMPANAKPPMSAQARPALCWNWI